jgi:hypothetical protein
MVTYLPIAVGPMPLVLDLHIAHDRFGSYSDPILNGHLHYPNDIDESLNETVTDKIRKYRVDYNNNPTSAVSFMPAIASTSGRLHSEFIRLLFLQTHRETDRFFASSGVQLTQPNRGLFHFYRAVFSATLIAKVGSTIAKTAVLRIRLNVDGSSPINPVYPTRVDFSALVFSLSSHRHSYIGLVFTSPFLIHDKQKVRNLDPQSLTNHDHVTCHVVIWT